MTKNSQLSELSTAYEGVAWYFDRWVKVMELATRKREVAEGDLGTADIAIVSPPTDYGIKLLAAANRNGHTSLVCFSSEGKQKGERYLATSDRTGLDIVAAAYFELPFADNSLDALFANCFFDFCQPEEFPGILGEITRILKPGGKLFAVYMEKPRCLPGRLWRLALALSPTVSYGVHAVNITAALPGSGFGVYAEEHLSRLGLPICYLVAQRI